MNSRPLMVYWASASSGTIFQGLRRVREISLPRTSAVKPGESVSAFHVGEVIGLCWVDLPSRDGHFFAGDAILKRD